MSYRGRCPFPYNLAKGCVEGWFGMFHWIADFKKAVNWISTCIALPSDIRTRAAATKQFFSALRVSKKPLQNTTVWTCLVKRKCHCEWLAPCFMCTAYQPKSVCVFLNAKFLFEKGVSKTFEGEG